MFRFSTPRRRASPSRNAADPYTPSRPNVVRPTWTTNLLLERISSFGIFVKSLLTGGVAKSIYTAEQEKLQALLRQIRTDAGLTQVDLAKRLGRPQSFVSKYESGERRLDLVELRRVCQELGVTLTKLVAMFEAAIKP